MAVVKSPKNHRKKLFWKYKYKTTQKHKLKSQKNISLLVRNYSIKEQNIRIENFNLKTKQNVSYIYDVKTCYNDPKFLMMAYPNEKFFIIITKKLVFHKNFNKKRITTKRINNIYARQFRKVTELYVIFIENYFKNTMYTALIDVPADEYEKAYSAWSKFAQTPKFISFLEEFTDYTVMYDKDNNILKVDNHPVIILKEIYEYVKPKLWVKKKKIQEKTPNVDIPLDKTLDIPEKRVVYKKHGKSRFYKKYNKS